MTLMEIEHTALFQTNNDIEDQEEFMPYMEGYANEGYDKLVYAFADKHTSKGDPDWPTLTLDGPEPKLPQWTHQAIADYTTWMLYRNGNPQKQNRGLYFLRAFEDVLNRIKTEGGMKGQPKNFFNLPT